MREFSETRRPPLLDLLKTGGPQNVPELARALGINPNAVRQQLAVLHREGLVEMKVERRPVGRPTHLWSVSERAQSLFPQAYAPMAVALLRHLRATEGETRIDRFFADRTKDLAARYRKRLAGKSRAEMFQELARIRDEEGYLARASRADLTEHHCPIAAIAKEFPQACRWEHRLFEEMLRSPLERTEHIASGGRACVYRPRR